MWWDSKTFAVVVYAIAAAASACIFAMGVGVALLLYHLGVA